MANISNPLEKHNWRLATLKCNVNSLSSRVPSGPLPARSIFGKRELFLMFLVVLAVSSVCSHLMVELLHVKVTGYGYKHYGKGQEEPIILYGSSVSYSGIDWNKVSDVLGRPITSWASFGSTPSEWALSSYGSRHASRSFIVVSIEDLNEFDLSDFRADFVPLSTTIIDLNKTHADKRLRNLVLSQYPLKAVRTLFPTVGRSDGVMVGIRYYLQKANLLDNRTPIDRLPPNVVDDDGGLALDQRVSDWSPGHLERQFAVTRAGFQGMFAFNSLKKLAMVRLFEASLREGEVTWVILPQSQAYQKQFLDPASKSAFEAEVEYFQHHYPRARLIRLDGLPPLQSDTMFADLIHINRVGQQVATAALLSQLKN